MPIINYKKEDYPENLLSELFRDEDTAVVLPADFEISLEYTLWKLSKQHERGVEILLKRYRDKKSYEQIGNEYGVTRERVRQIVARMIRYLRHPSRLNIIRHGISGMIDIHGQEEYKKGYNLGYRDGYSSAKDEEVSYKATVERLNPNIEDMDLSVRSFNCLMRAGLKTANDIAKLDFNQLSRIRNLGRKSLNEVVQRMEELGFDTRHMRWSDDDDRKGN